MNAIRDALAVVISLALIAGYAFSQRAFWTGTASDYAKRVDIPAVSWLALAILAIIVVSALTNGAKEESDS